VEIERRVEGSDTSTIGSAAWPVQGGDGGVVDKTRDNAEHDDPPIAPDGSPFTFNAVLGWFTLVRLSVARWCITAEAGRCGARV